MISWLDLDASRPGALLRADGTEWLRLPGDNWRYGYVFTGTTELPLDLSEIARYIAMALWVSLPSDELYDVLVQNRAEAKLIWDSAEARRTGTLLWSSDLAQEFRSRCGAAVPCANAADRVYARHLGMDGIVLPDLLLLAIEAQRGTFAERIEFFLQETVTEVGPLAPNEQALWDWALKLIKVACPDFALEKIRLVRFDGDRLYGLWRNGEILIGKNCLADSGLLVSTIVHEVAHAQGIDGSVEHVREIELISGRIVQHQQLQIHWLCREVAALRGQPMKSQQPKTRGRRRAK